MSKQITGSSPWHKDHVIADAINYNGDQLDELAKLTREAIASLNAKINVLQVENDLLKRRVANIEDSCYEQIL